MPSKLSHRSASPLGAQLAARVLAAPQAQELPLHTPMTVLKKGSAKQPCFGQQHGLISVSSLGHSGLSPVPSVHVGHVEDSVLAAAGHGQRTDAASKVL
mmetsp:Transcript_30546/g.79309  ORF Transcript_30546/g.79309 Transcript_30546/m.79309 type:complete len:99 (+) Transcript_30546:119-415(+)